MMCDMLWGEQLKGCDHCHHYKKILHCQLDPWGDWQSSAACAGTWKVNMSSKQKICERLKQTALPAPTGWWRGGKSVLFTYSQTASALIAAWWRGISCSLTLRNNPWFNTHSDTNTHSHWVSPLPPPDEVIIAGRESPCIDRPFSTRAPHTYI